MSVYGDAGLTQILDGDGKIIIPDWAKRIRIDVGTSIDAPNTAIWLNKYDDLFVIMVEPNSECRQHLTERTCSDYPDIFDVVSISKNATIRKGEKLTDITGKFYLLTCAIDNVKEPCYQEFHMTGDKNIGCSSLLKPTAKLDIPTKRIVDVPIITLADILSRIPDRFEHIDVVKTDTQGKDLEVLKSAGKYLKKIIHLNVETWTMDSYEDACLPYQVRAFLTNSGFVHQFGRVSETFFNTKQFGNTEFARRDMTNEFLAL